jgi:hypothetical protein
MLETSSYFSDLGEWVDVEDGDGVSQSTRIISVGRVDQGCRCLREKEFSGEERSAR